MEAHILEIDIFDLPQLVLEIIELRGPRRYKSQTGGYYISHYYSGSRRVRMKQPINRLFLSSRRTF